MKRSIPRFESEEEEEERTPVEGGALEMEKG